MAGFFGAMQAFGAALGGVEDDRDDSNYDAGPSEPTTEFVTLKKAMKKHSKAKTKYIGEESDDELTASSVSTSTKKKGKEVKKPPTQKVAQFIAEDYDATYPASALSKAVSESKQWKKKGVNGPATEVVAGAETSGSKKRAKAAKDKTTAPTTFSNAQTAYQTVKAGTTDRLQTGLAVTKKIPLTESAIDNEVRRRTQVLEAHLARKYFRTDIPTNSESREKMFSWIVHFSSTDAVVKPVLEDLACASVDQMKYVLVLRPTQLRMMRPNVLIDTSTFAPDLDDTEVEGEDIVRAQRRISTFETQYTQYIGGDGDGIHRLDLTTVELRQPDTFLSVPVGLDGEEKVIDLREKVIKKKPLTKTEIKQLAYIRKYTNTALAQTFFRLSGGDGAAMAMIERHPAMREIAQVTANRNAIQELAAMYQMASAGQYSSNVLAPLTPEISQLAGRLSIPTDDVEAPADYVFRQAQIRGIGAS